MSNEDRAAIEHEVDQEARAALERFEKALAALPLPEPPEEHDALRAFLEVVAAPDGEPSLIWKRNRSDSDEPLRIAPAAIRAGIELVRALDRLSEAQRRAIILGATAHRPEHERESSAIRELVELFPPDE